MDERCDLPERAIGGSHLRALAHGWLEGCRQEELQTVSGSSNMFSVVVVRLDSDKGGPLFFHCRVAQVACARTETRRYLRWALARCLCSCECNLV